MRGDNHDIDVHAAQWVDRMRQPLQDAALAAEFDRWILTDPRHVEAYARLSAVWRSDSLEHALSQTATMRVASNDDDRPDPARRSGMGWRRIAGASAASLGLFSALLFGPPLLVEQSTYATPRGVTRIVTLSDGSTIRMNGATRIAVRITPWSRHVALDRGEAYFDVAHEQVRGFSVDTGGPSIAVLGTAFDVERMDQDTRVIQVYRGLVSVDMGAGRRWRLPAGSGLEVAGDRVRSLRGGMAQPGWIEGWYEANDTPVWQLVERLNRTSPRPIGFADPALGELLVTGRFPIDRPAAVLDALAAIHDLRWRYDGTRYTVSR
ncbi:FecR family protein [Sphingomonas sp. 37zxx]|uniref:FecR family protein n=1 Tax=Sphingomonas sp. 37zxx TaxID=1550073 RepID=UPI00053BF1D7|nr:FecR domain-containing protein [Sphingomonas sp. 37zxx]